ncbi:hypothetical protein LSH36_2531g00002 [Paralvinella palmiformis]|uniref:TNase-like domain-containing protein n=1 Tax=Paralvinella palmiformis TaxID=53620 RepID=A0AAD9IQI5_9ANNE|nr:hypothetical protein LSH36_2531g00002 [Paralvinella palmiformis]
MSRTVMNYLNYWINETVWLFICCVSPLIHLQTKKFCKVNEIPVRFITKHVRLQGHVEKVSPEGVLSVQHTPILTTRWSNQSQDVPLPITLTAIDLLPPGINWLQSQLNRQHIWFRLMSTRDAVEVSAVVTWKQKWYKQAINVNYHLVSNGIATYKCEGQLIGDQTYDGLAASLCRAEITAEKKGRGVWKRVTLRERIMTYPQEVREKVISKKEEFKKSWIDWINIKFRKKTSN